MHNKKHFVRSVVCLLLALLFSLQAFALQPWEITWQLVWSVANVKVLNQMCTAMEGMGADEKYVYTAKIPSNGSYCNLTRTEIDTGAQTHLKYYPSLSAKTAEPCTVCGHANDIAVVRAGSKTALYVATVQKKTAITKLRVIGDGAYLTGYFELLRADGKTSFAASSVRLIRRESGKLYFLVKSGLYYYGCVIDATATGGPADAPTQVICPRLFEIDTRSAQFYNADGSTYGIDNLETWVNQGATLDSSTGVLYVPLYNGTNDNAIILYDVSPYLGKAALTATADSDKVLFPQNVSFRITRPDQREFEIESCDFRSAGGGGELLLYFNNNASLISVEGIYATNYTPGSVALLPLVADDAVVYTVKYKANGGAQNTALETRERMSATRHVATIATNLRPNTFLAPAETPYFAGWNLYRASDKAWHYTNADGTAAWYKAADAPADAARTLFPDRAPMPGMSEKNGDTLYAWAQWETKPYYLFFDLQDGTAPTDSKKLHFGEAFGTLPAPTKEGYAFDGWRLPDGTPVTAQTVFDFADNVTLTAQWTELPPQEEAPQKNDLLGVVSFFRRILDWLRALFGWLIPG